MAHRWWSLGGAFAANIETTTSGDCPSQALNAIPDPYPELNSPPPTNGKLVALPVLGGVQHDYRLAA